MTGAGSPRADRTRQPRVLHILTRLGPSRGSESNKSEFPTDKSLKPHFLRLTGGISVPVFTEIEASGDILVT